MATEEPLLDLKTVTGKFHIRIDGVPHFLAHPDSLTLRQWTQLETLAPRIAVLTLAVGKGDTVSEDDERELSVLLDKAARIVLDAPEVVHEKLMDMHRAAIMNAFFRLRLEGRTTETTTEAAKIGAKSSRVSKGSTAALRKAG